MKRGPKPKPTALKIAQGNAGHRPLNDAEPPSIVGDPVWPEAIKNDVAKQRWFGLVADLREMGVLARTDGDAMVNYCLCYAKLIDAQTRLDSEALIVNVNGTPQHNPYMGIVNKAMEQMRKLGSEFGLTPSSRSTLRITKKETESPLNKFLAGGVG